MAKRNNISWCSIVQKSSAATAMAALGCVLNQVAAANNLVWTGNITDPAPLWGTAGNWSPSGPPNPGDSVGIVGNIPLPPGGYAFRGPVLNVDTTISNLTMGQAAYLGSGINGAPDFARNLTVTGNTAIDGSIGVIVAVNGCTYSLGTLLSQQNATLLAGSQLLVLADHNTDDGPAVIQWRGANIVRNEGAIVLAGGSAFLRNQDNGQSALLDFEQNGGYFDVLNGTFVCSNVFSNFGTVEVDAFRPGISSFFASQGMANYNASTGVLLGGTIRCVAQNGGEAVFQFPGADIRTLGPNTSIILTGNSYIRDSISGANGLRNLGSLGGDFTVGAALGLTPANGTLEQVAGTIDVVTNGALTLTGNLQQFQGARINVAQGASLVVQGNITFAHTLNLRNTFGFAREGANRPVVTGNDIDFTADSTFVGDGIINGNTNFFGAVELGDFANAQPGQLDLYGSATFGTGATMRVVVGGTGPGEFSSVIHHEKGGTLYLDGTLEIAVDPNFTPLPGDVFSVVQSELISGAPHTVMGRRVNDTTWLVAMRNLEQLFLAVALPGDATLDGVVSISDFALVAANFNQDELDWTGGDFDANGSVNISDFALLASNFNRSAADLPRSSVPEPSIAIIPVSVLLIGTGRRRI